jgi:hypothetical protein
VTVSPESLTPAVNRPNLGATIAFVTPAGSALHAPPSTDTSPV